MARGDGPHLRWDDVSLAWGEEEIGFEAVLTGVKVVIAPARSKERTMCTSFNDAARFDHP